VKLTPFDLLLLGLSTFRIGRMIAFDALKMNLPELIVPGGRADTTEQPREKNPALWSFRSRPSCR